jgi:predicted DNA-binding protein with PD1-like motif
MKSKLLSNEAARVFAVIFDKGDEVVSTLTAFAHDTGLAATRVTAIGAFSHATLGYFNKDKMEYDRIEVDDQVEALSLIGNFALTDGVPRLHAHVVLGRRDGSTCGGHLIEAHVWPTLEAMVVEAPNDLVKTVDEETGLALIDLDVGVADRAQA